MNDEQFLHLATLYLEDSINEYYLDLLNRELARSTERIRQFNDLRLLAGLINEHGYTIDSEDTADLAANSPLDTGGLCFYAGYSEANSESNFTSWRAIAIALGVLATAVSLLLGTNWPYELPTR